VAGEPVTRYHTSRLVCHAVGLLLEAIGSFFVLMDAIRLNELASILGLFSYAGEPEKFHPWYYHSLVLGFCLLFGGILFQGIVLWLEHLSHVRSLTTVPQAPNPLEVHTLPIGGSPPPSIGKRSDTFAKILLGTSIGLLVAHALSKGREQDANDHQ
jgi:hypothetical protein